MSKKTTPVTAIDAWETRKSYNRHPEKDDDTVILSTTSPQDTSVHAPEKDTQEPQNPAKDESVEKDLVASLTKARNDNLSYINELKDKIASLEANNNQPKLPKTEAEVEEWAKKHPDLYNILISEMERRLIKSKHDISKEIQDVKEKTKELEAQKAFNEVLKVHPDANEIKVDQRFKDWAAAQTAGIKALLDSDSVKDAILVLNLYKEDVGITNDKKASAKEAAYSPSGKSTSSVPDDKPIYRESQVAKWSGKQFDKMEKEIDLARAEGRFIYDLSRRG